VVLFVTCPDYKPFSQLQKRHMAPDLHDIDHMFLTFRGQHTSHGALSRHQMVPGTGANRLLKQGFLDIM
jgi:hypothetical protein